VKTSFIIPNQIRYELVDFKLTITEKSVSVNHKIKAEDKVGLHENVFAGINFSATVKVRMQEHGIECRMECGMECGMETMHKKLKHYCRIDWYTKCNIQIPVWVASNQLSLQACTGPT